MSDKTTVVNLSNHVYFNLAGHATGWQQLAQHQLTVPHGNYTPDDADYLPTGIAIAFLCNSLRVKLESGFGKMRRF
jgi:aldose 1-epimerase